MQHSHAGRINLNSITEHLQSLAEYTQGDNKKITKTEQILSFMHLKPLALSKVPFYHRNN